MFLLNLFILNVILVNILNTIHAVEPCKPQMASSGSIPEKGGVIPLDCIFASCASISTVVFQKWDDNEPPKWVSVYESVDKTKHQALDTGPKRNYSLVERSVEYTLIRTKHTLSLDPAKLEDGGQWRCLVIDTNKDDFTSDEWNITIYVEPRHQRFIQHSNDFKIVTNQKEKFKCVVQYVHPKPILTWKINGAIKNGVSDKSTLNPSDGLWNVTSIISLTFMDPGDVLLVCILSAGDKQHWKDDTLSFNVKEAAKVINITQPVSPILTNTLFTLTCTGKGYGQRIKWTKNGQLITRDQGYTIEGCEDAPDDECTSTLSSQLVENESECRKAFGYSGNYTCHVELDEVYRSKDESGPIQVIVKSYIPVKIGTPQNDIMHRSRCSKTAQLRCDVCAENKTSDRWFFKGRDITSGNLVDGTPGEIQISSTGYGYYTRYVTTSEGTANCTVQYEKGPSEICAGGIAGLVVGVVILILALSIALGVLITRYLKKRKTANRQSVEDSATHAAETTPMREMKCDSRPQ